MSSHQYRKHVWFSVIMLSSCFLGFFTLSLLVPMHSDDYYYKLLGMGINDHVKHYVTWSGRVVADYISPFLLQIQSEFLTALLQSAVLFGLAWVIGTTPKVLSKDAPSWPSSGLWWTLYVFLLIFLSAPSFSQMSLWIVGSANYMWTALLYALMVRTLVVYVYSSHIPVYAYLLALAAGCTNESAAVVIVVFGFMIAAWQFWKNRSFDLRLLAIIALMLTGTLILVGAPGNKARLSCYEAWAELSLLEQFQAHLSRRFLKIFEKSKLVYAVCLVVIWLGLRPVRRKILDVKGMPTATLWSVIFFGLALLASLVMVASPTVPTRSLTPAFIFALFSAVMGTFALTQSYRSKSYFVGANIFMFGISSLFFLEILSYYRSLAGQEVFRSEIIQQKRSDSVALPDFYGRWLPGGSSSMYTISRFASPGSMASYYGLEKVDLYEAKFDYSILKKPAISHEMDAAGAADSLINVWVYSEKYFLHTNFVLELVGSSDTEITKVEIEYVDFMGKIRHVTADGYALINDRKFVYATVNYPRILMKNWAVKNVEKILANNHK